MSNGFESFHVTHVSTGKGNYPSVRHLDEKQASKYEFDFDDEDDDFLLITIDGIYKQIYIGRDIPINYNNCSLSVQPLIEEIKEDMQYYLE